MPALVTVGSFCRPAHGASSGAGKAAPASVAGGPVQAGDSVQASGTAAIVIGGKAIPSGERLSIGLFPSYTRMLLVQDGAPLSCGGTSHQPAEHITPSGTPIRG
ncbi:MAG: hypothetical protein ACRDN0_37020 [Trebonia sp.]